MVLTLIFMRKDQCEVKNAKFQLCIVPSISGALHCLLYALRGLCGFPIGWRS